MIDLQRVHKQYNSFHLSIEKLTISKGLTLLAGKNGAGKTTLLEMLATAIYPDCGVITYAGKSEEEDLPLIRSEIGYLPAEIEPYEEMTVSQFLRHLGELKGLDESEMTREGADWMKVFRLDEVGEVKIQHLSEGERRRVVIAQAFLGYPTFLFLDEPLNNLDIEEQRRLTALLYRYAAQRAVIVSTHELNRWDGQCDALLLLDGGTVRFYGSPLEWVHHPSLSVWEGTVERRELPQWLNRYRVIRTQLEIDQRHRLRLIAAERPDTRFTQVPANLEDGYFLQSRD